MTATFTVLATAAANPKNLCFDPTGRYLYYVSASTGRLSQYDTQTSTYTLARFGTGTAGSTNGAAGVGQINNPQQICTDGTWVYWTEFSTNTKVRRANIGSGAIEDFVGTVAGTADGTGLGAASTATFQNLKGMCINTARTKLYLSHDTVIRVVTISDGTTTTLPMTMFQTNVSLTIDPTDSWLYGTSSTCKIWRAPLPTPAFCTFVAGNGQTTADVDGLGRLSQMRDVTQLCATPTNLFISEQVGSILRQVPRDPNNVVPNMTTVVDSNATPLTFTGCAGVVAWPGQAADTLVASDYTGNRLLKIVIT